MTVPGSSHLATKLFDVCTLFTIMLRFVSSSFNRSRRTFTSMASSTPTCKLALVQLAVTADKNDNLANARTHVLEAASKGANLVVLPVQFSNAPS